MDLMGGSLAYVTMSKAKTIDAIDKRILRIIQKDACLPVHEIAARVALSQTPCWTRLQQLKVSGVIKHQVALLDPVKLGLRTTVFVAIEVGESSGDALARFAKDVMAMEEVMDFYRLAGDVDYLLRVVVPDAAAFDAFYKRLIELMPLKSVTSRFSLENLKSKTAFPIKD
jgi:Lrp/AsnC family transcriptional regulator